MYFSLGGTVVPCPHFSIFSAPFCIPSARSACGSWWWWAGVCVRLGSRRGWIVIVIPLLVQADPVLPTIIYFHFRFGFLGIFANFVLYLFLDIVS